MGNINYLQSLNQKQLVYGLLTVGFATAAVVNCKRVYKTDQKIRIIDNIIEYSPDECMNQLEKRMEEKNIGDSRKYSQLAEGEIIVRNMLISGIAQCDQPLPSKIDPSKDDFIYRYNFCILKYSNDELRRLFSVGRAANQSPKTLSAQYVPEFNLIDKDNQEKKLEVWVHLQPKICQSSLNHHSERYTDRQINIYQKIRSSLSTVLNCFGLLFTKEKNIQFSRGVEIGFSEYELGIRTGGLLAILGDVIYNTQTKQLKMINPLTIIGDKIKYIEKLLNKQKENQFYLATFTILSCVFFYLLSSEYQRLYRGGRMLINQQQDSLKNIKYALVKNVNDMKCDLCNENNKQIINKPCGHLIYCKNCHLSMKLSECSTCKALIQESVEIYLS